MLFLCKHSKSVTQINVILKICEEKKNCIRLKWTQAIWLQHISPSFRFRIFRLLGQMTIWHCDCVCLPAKSMISSCDASVSACSYSSPMSMAIFSSASRVFSSGGGGIHFLPRTMPATNGSSSGTSGVSIACLLMCSMSFLRFNGPVADFSHS